MKTGLVICGPDVDYGPLALLSGCFDEKTRKAAQLGFNGIELMVRDPHALDWPAIKSVVRETGLEIPQIVTGELFGADGLSLVTNDEDCSMLAIDRTRSVIDLAAYLGAMVNLGRLRGRLDLVGGGPKAWKIAVDRIGQVVEYAEIKGVKISLEPINRYETDFIMTVAEGIQLISDLKTCNMGLMLDLFHMNIEEDSIERSLQLAGEYLWHVHIADSHRRYPGSGHLDFDPIFNVLNEMNYQGYISAELLPLPDPDTAAIKTIEFLRSRLVSTATR